MFNQNQPSYQRLRKIYAERTSDLTFWTGAGLSQPALLPTWHQLKNIMLKQALEQLNTLSEMEAAQKEHELQEITEELSNWRAFSILKRVMGDVNYTACIRDLFEKAEKLDVPAIYKEIWRLPGVSSLLTLNIDKFVYRAHRDIRASEDIAQFCGCDVSDYLHLVKRRKPFIANLHGIHEVVKSWVFTEEDFKKLYKDQNYNHFVNLVFSDFTVVFIGISAEDNAAGGFLERLTGRQNDVGQHFWITDRKDTDASRWANKAGIQIIHYDPVIDETGKPDHTSVLSEIFQDLRAYISKEELSPAVTGDVRALEHIPSERELRMNDDDDELRIKLAGHAKALIERNQGNTQCEEYQVFLREYSRTIHQAWHITDNAPHNKFHGYTVSKKIASGPFSAVWRLSDQDGNQYALKIIHLDNLTKGTQLESFRRGVRSLEYLTKAEVPGAPKLVCAFEIPTCIITNFVDGANFDEILSSRDFDFWTDGLNILINICQHLEFSHTLPQIVLHRDVRPSNVMVPWYYWDEATLEATNSAKYDVALLNFDMSWHATARGPTMPGNVDESGYYAPEQLRNIDDGLARSAKVDSYGIGMTIYRAFSGQKPPVGGSLSVEWSGKTKGRFRPVSSWLSAANRLNRIIKMATLPDSEARLSVRTIHSELKQLRDALDKKWGELSPDYWAEEISFRVLGSDYIVDGMGDDFKKEIVTGRVISIKGNLKGRTVAVKYSNTATEVTDWNTIDKRWPEKLEVAKQILKSGGWEIADSTHYGRRQIILQVSIAIEMLIGNFSSILDILERGLNKVRLD